MNEYLKRLFRNFARPELLHRYHNTKIQEFDKRLEDVDKKQLDLRMRLLEIQGTPRGSING